MQYIANTGLDDKIGEIKNHTNNIDKYIIIYHEGNLESSCIMCKDELIEYLTYEKEIFQNYDFTIYVLNNEIYKNIR